MKRFAEEILAKIDAEIRLRNCGVNSTMDNALYMVRFIAPMYEQLREMIISYSFPSVEDEICFFKENEKDIKDIKPIYIEGLDFVYVDNISEVLKYIFE